MLSPMEDDRDPSYTPFGKARAPKPRARVRHVERTEDLLLKKVAIARARDTLNKGAENEKAEVAISGVFPGSNVNGR
jgi:hypothetical protein